MDGPVGVVALGQALAALGYQPEIVVPDVMVPVVRAMQGVVRSAVPVLPSLSLRQDNVAEWAERYDGAIAVEKLGRNANGVRHTIKGTPLPDEETGLDDLFALLLRSGKFTLGIGDFGNEIGFGKVYHLARELVLFGTECGCPCHGGIVTATATKHLLPAAISNTGAYGVLAALALWHHRQELIPAGTTIVNIIRAGMREGCVDGGTADPTFVGDDGVPGDTIEGIVTVLGAIVSQWFTEFRRRF
jgi:hypothetical protein